MWGFVNAVRNPGPSVGAAEYVLAPAGGTALRPRTVSAVEAAAVGAVGASALGILRDVLRLQPGERVLVRGANGGVGTAAVQVARALGGQVTALASAPHLDRLRDLGAQQAYDYHVTSPGDLGRFDVILDPVSKNMTPYRKLLTKKGRMAAMALGSPADLAYLLGLGGPRQPPGPASPRARPPARCSPSLARYVDDKSVVPVIEAVFPLDDIAAAHRSLDKSGGFGKRVIQVA